MIRAGSAVAIETSDVGVVIDDVTLLRPVSLSVGPAQALIVRGHNGAGKSTFLSVLVGSRAPTSGIATVGGRKPSKRDRTFRRKVAAMIGLPPMAPDLTIGDHVRLVAATWFDDPAQAEAVAEDVLGSLGLSALVHRFPHELSTGQLQVAGLSLVLARPFDVLLLDEPEQRLDPDRLRTVGEVLARRRDEGACLVVATHSTALAEQLGDRTLDLGADR